jgi:hypothetical protein
MRGKILPVKCRSLFLCVWVGERVLPQETLERERVLVSDVYMVGPPVFLSLVSTIDFILLYTHTHIQLH